MAPSNDMDDLLALVQPPTAAPAAASPSTNGGAHPTTTTPPDVDLSTLTPSDLALLQPLMRLLNLSPAEAAALSSDTSTILTDGVEDDETLDDEALQRELERLDEAALVAGSLEGSLDRLLDRLAGLEGEVGEEPAGADASEAAGGEKKDGEKKEGK